MLFHGSYASIIALFHYILIIYLSFYQVEISSKKRDWIFSFFNLEILKLLHRHRGRLPNEILLSWCEKLDKILRPRMTWTISTHKLYPQSFKKNSKRITLINLKSSILLLEKKKQNNFKNLGCFLTWSQIPSCTLWFLHFSRFKIEIILHYLQLLIGDRGYLFHTIYILYLQRKKMKKFHQFNSPINLLENTAKGLNVLIG